MAGPSPIPFFDPVSAYQRTEATLPPALLDLFTPIAETKGSLPETAARCAASERGVRILCDFSGHPGLSHQDRRTLRACRGDRAVPGQGLACLSGRIVGVPAVARSGTRLRQP